MYTQKHRLYNRKTITQLIIDDERLHKKEKRGYQDGALQKKGKGHGSKNTQGEGEKSAHESITPQLIISLIDKSITYVYP